MMGRRILGLLVFIALFGDFLASDRPIVMSVSGELYFATGLPSDQHSGKTRTGEELADVMTAEDWALWAPIRHDPLSVRTGGRLEILASPGTVHWLGTDDRGRDVASRLIHGTRVSLLLALLCALMASVLGVILALVATRNRYMDTIVIVGCDAVAALPVLLVVLMIRGLVGSQSLTGLVLLIGLTRAAATARLVRDGMRSAMAKPFFDAAKALGYGKFRLLWRHALPQCYGQIRVAAALTASTAVLAEVALSFLGLGIAGPEPSWGELLRQAQENSMRWWLLFPAGIATTALAWALSSCCAPKPPISGG